MTGVAGAVSSARPEDLQGYHDDVVRRIGLVERSLHHVMAAVAAYEVSCAEVPLALPERVSIAEPVGDVRTLARRVAEVAEAFLLADRSLTGGMARTTDGAVARVILDRFPQLADATVLGAVADELAIEAADGIERAATDGPGGMAELRASVPARLASDPVFARAVMARVDHHRLAATVDRLASDARPGYPSADLRWLGSLFARGAADVDGRPTDATRHLLGDAPGRTAVRILRASSRARLPVATVEVIARAAIRHPSPEDRSHLFLIDEDGRDTGDDALFLDAAEHHDLALRLLTGADPAHPAPRRIERLVQASAGNSQLGMAALLRSARQAPQRHVDGALTPAGLILQHGTVAALASSPPRRRRTAGPDRSLVEAGLSIVLDHSDLAAAHTRGSDAEVSGDEPVEQLTRLLEHAAHDPVTWAVALDGSSRRRLAATTTAIRDGDLDALDLVGRFDAVLARAAARADVPDRVLDPVIHGAAEAGGDLLVAKYGGLGASAASSALRAGGTRLGDAVAEDPGTAVAQLEAGGTARADRILAVVDALPGQVVWAGSGVSGRAELVAAAREAGGDDVLEQWELAQTSEVHEVLHHLRTAYRRGFEAVR